MQTNDRTKRPLSEKEVERRDLQRREAMAPRGDIEGELDQVKHMKSLKYRKRLLSRGEIEAEYGLPKRWLELAALSGNGPPMTRISTRMVRYQRGTFEDWLAARTVSSTSETVEAA